MQKKRAFMTTNLLTCWYEMINYGGAIVKIAILLSHIKEKIVIIIIFFSSFVGGVYVFLVESSKVSLSLSLSFNIRLGRIDNMIQWRLDRST